MNIIFYKSDNLASTLVEPLIYGFAEKMKAPVLIVENDDTLPNPSVIVRDDYNKELFRSSDLPAIKHLLNIKISDIPTPSVRNRKILIAGGVAAVVATLGIIIYKKRKARLECACE